MSQSTIYETALEYTRRGWVVIPVYGMMPDGVTCACSERSHCAKPGKHPIGAQWQRRGPLSAADCYTLFAEPDPQSGAYRNAGLLTGRASGVWVLDEDPGSGGTAALAALESSIGPLPTTLTNRTGSGGRHFFWKMPDFPLDNSRGRLPEFGPGLDVRGDGGQVVIPGSVSNRGRYEGLVAAEVAPAPLALLELLRAPVVSGAVGAGVTEVAGLPFHDDLPAERRERLQKYATGVCSSELNAYVTAPPGTGSTALYRATISMIEIAQSPWNLVTLEQVGHALEQARAARVAQHPFGGGQSPAELRRIWESALQRAAGRGRPLPEHPDAGVRLDIPFTHGPQAPGERSGVGVVYDEITTTPGAPADGTHIDLAALRAEGVLRPPVEGASGWGALGATAVLEREVECPDLEVVRGELDGLRETEERKSYLRSLVPSLVACETAEVMVWRDVCCEGSAGLRRGEFDTLLREAKKAHAAEREEREAAARRAANAARAEEARLRGTLLPGPHAPMAVARELVKRWPATDDVPHLLWWRGDWYVWDGTKWPRLADTMLRQRLYLATEHASYERGEDGELAPWNPRRSNIGDVERAMAEAIVQRPAEVAEDRVTACMNGILDFSDLSDIANGVLTVHHPRTFNLNALPFVYDPAAQCPEWEKFLIDVLPGDEGARLFLQEWAGYLISGQTDLQKICTLSGPRRSGKSTTAKVFSALIGADALAAPSITSLAGDFGLQALIGKALAVMSDINWNVQGVPEASEILKKVSGEDVVEVNRKGREAWVGRLGARWMIVGNDLPKFSDPSGALAGRMIHVVYRKSFYGREDPGLESRLMEEMPGILNWAVLGLQRLRARGRFAEPESSVQLSVEVARHTSPVEGFLQDCALVTENARELPLDQVYAVYRQWCAREGRERIPVKSAFSRDLQSVGGAIQVKRERRGGSEKTYWVYGLVPAYEGALTPLGGMNEWIISGHGG